MAAEQFWDTANQRTLSESAALTLMTPYAHQLLTRARQDGRSITTSGLAEQVQRLSNIEVRQDHGDWITALLGRVDQRCASADQPALSGQVRAPSTPASASKPTTKRRPVGKNPTPARRPSAAAPLEGSICPSCFTQMSLTGVCDQCA